jgi:hypothetical protein
MGLDRCFFNQLEIFPVIAETKRLFKAALVCCIISTAISSKVTSDGDYYKVKFFNRTAQQLPDEQANLCSHTNRSSADQSMDTDCSKSRFILLHQSKRASCTAVILPCPAHFSHQGQVSAARIKLDIDNTTRL